MYGAIFPADEADSDQEELTMERNAGRRNVNGDIRGDEKDTPNGTITEPDPLDDRRSFKERCLGNMKENILLLLIILGLVFGIVIGVIIRSQNVNWDKRQKMYFRFLGDLLMRMLRMLIIPLIVSTLVSGLARLDAQSAGKLGLRAVVYYLATTFIAVVLGIILVLTIRPGTYADAVVDTGTAVERANPADSFLDLIRNMLPDNIVAACFKQTKTKQIDVHRVLYFNVSETTPPPGIGNGTWNGTLVVVEHDFEVRQEDGMNVLGLVVFSVALGVVISRLGEKGKPLLYFFSALADATMVLVTVVIWYSPIGIMFLVASEIVNMTDPVRELQALGMYMVTVLSGLAIHGIIILPLLYFIVIRKNPFKFIYGALQALATALGTASSSATLPVTYRCLEENNGVDNRVTRFVLPVGATVNMDGTALYEAVAAIYIAQMRGRNLNFAQIVAASLTATLASIGAASVPQAGIVTMIIVLTALGLPAEDVSKILAVDWLLDRFRTMINVEGDSIGAAIVAHLSRKDLEEHVEHTTDVDLAPLSAYSIENPQTELATGQINQGFDALTEQKTQL